MRLTHGNLSRPRPRLGRVPFQIMLRLLGVSAMVRGLFRNPGQGSFEDEDDDEDDWVEAS
jgi:hypothetical protein